MSQTKQQEQGAAAARPRTRKYGELFWRIIAGLMLLVIVWVAWVMYQIAPRSVVTPLAYASQVKPIGTQPLAPGAAAAAVPEGAAVPAAPQPAPEAAAVAAAAKAMEAAQEAARAGAHQASADVQAADLELQRAQQERQAQHEQSKKDGLRLATEISTPPAEKPRAPKAVKSDAPGAAGTAGKDRP